MTQLTGKVPGSTYGDLLTFNNNGQGVTANLQIMQDGLGNTSALQLSSTAANIQGNLTVSGTISGAGNQPLKITQLPTIAVAPTAVGLMYYDTSLNVLKVSVNTTSAADWKTVTFNP